METFKKSPKDQLIEEISRLTTDEQVQAMGTKVLTALPYPYIGHAEVMEALKQANLRIQLAKLDELARKDKLER